jgi:hypothetical protein
MLEKEARCKMKKQKHFDIPAPKKEIPKVAKEEAYETSH